MNTPKIVIGAGYGDEGKGLITDYLCSKHGADIVVRFNGGAQAGHTVELPSGERHVFSHFSSGTFAGAATYLSQFFIVNPMIYFKELSTFESLIRTAPDIYVDPRARVTTPYDMLINQMLEDSRGSGRHGSCGLGINETVMRSALDNERHCIYFSDLYDQSVLRSKLTHIRDEWVKHRCMFLGLDRSLRADIFDSENVFENFIEDSLEMANACIVEDPDFLANARQLVFEGAQGLLLDETYGTYPYVTHSHTGLQNALSILDDMGTASEFGDEVDVFYITRCYLTRHGAGPLGNELFSHPYVNVVDKTNIPNTYQGSLRYAYLDVDQLRDAISYDIQTDKLGFKLRAGLAVTCLDQLDNGEAKVYHNKGLRALKGDAYGDVGDMIYAMVGLDGPLLKSFGPTRLDVQERS